MNIMQQYREAHERHPGMLLLFRAGDFYELFDADAEKAAPLLGLALTTRAERNGEGCMMAGFPHQDLERKLRLLLKAGHRVAICDPVDATQPVIGTKVTRVVTKGLFDEAPG